MSARPRHAPGHMPAHAPSIRTLSRAEIDDVLLRNHVGRIAYAFHDRVDIEPIHYVYENGRVYGRTSTGAKLATLRHNPWVAFEVDEVDGLFDWVSVVLHGTFYRLEPDLPHEHDLREHVLTRLRELVPRALSPGDPTPWRDVLFRIVVNEAAGREARHEG